MAMSDKHMRRLALLAKKSGGKRVGKLIFGSVAGVFAMAGTVRADNFTWTGAASAGWSTSAVNWTDTTTGLASAWVSATGSSASFGSTSGHGFTITASSVKVNSITFQGSGSFTVNTGPFAATSGGSVQLLSSAGTNITDTFNTPFNFAGASYAFSNADTDPGTTLNFAGGLMGASTGTQTTLSLNGPGTGILAGTNTLSGTLANGSAARLAITMTAGGIWKISGSNSYTGITSVNGGADLIVANTAGSATGTGTVNMGGGTLASVGTLADVGGAVNASTGTNLIAPGGSGTVGALTINGVLTTATTSTLNFDLGSGSGEITNGDLLTLGSAPTIASGTPLTFGGTTTIGNDYRLIGDTTSGTIVNGITLGNFSLPAAPMGQSFALSTSVDANYIDLVVTAAASGPANLTWNNAGGTGDGTTWDIATNQNWNNGSSAAVYHEGDIVTFNDNNNGTAAPSSPIGSNANAYTVALNTTVHPKSVTVSTAGAYTISGTGGIADEATGPATPLLLTGSGSLTLGGTNTYTGGTTVGTGSDHPTLILSGASAFPSNAGAGTPLTVNSGATVQVVRGSSAGPVTITVSSYTNSGLIDLQNNEMLIKGGAGLVGTVFAQLKNGYDGGAWDGTSGIISSASAVRNSSLYTLGDAPSGGDLKVGYAYYGDANMDGIVDGSDYTLIDDAYAAQQAWIAGGMIGAQPNTGWQNGDFNYDGVVDGSDYSLIDNAFNFQTGSAPAALIAANTSEIAGGSSAVPEPTSLGVLGVGALGLMIRRRRKI
jgi:fibronectin-binding autotransporter adhesin